MLSARSQRIAIAVFLTLGLAPRLATALTLTSTSFASGGEIPKKHTCNGGDVSTALSWSEVPEGTKSLALIVDDPDAPDPAAPQQTWVHWVVYDIPPSVTSLTEGAATSVLPAGTRSGRNDWNKPTYGGPCPAVGRHRYFHRLYALDVVLPDLREPSKALLQLAMKGHILATVELVGTYQQ